MLKRKIYDELLKWKKSAEHKSLLVKGARQVGKTFIIDLFGKQEFKSYIYLNFLKNESLKEIFNGSLEPDDIYAQISLRVNNVEFVENDTLIFFDEIQACPKARTALKFLSIDRRYRIIASGSLLGIKYKERDEESFSVPVGYEKDIEMFPLDFEEYLWARGVNDSAVSALKNYFLKREKVPDDINSLYMRYFKEYICVGGMPDVVNTFIATNNFQAVHEKQNEILQNYRDDIMHYAPNTMKQKITNCYNSIPAQFSKEYTKFQYSVIESKGTSKKYESTVDWLLDAGMVKKCINVSTPLFPLKGYEKPNEFKLYLTDTGLLTSMFGFNTQAAIMSDELKSTAKGGIFENAAFVCLMNRIKTLHYFKNSNNTQEIEFIFESKSGTEVIPVEVKAKNGQTISLNNFIETFKPAVAYKVIDGNIGVFGQKFTIPFYMLLFAE
ncbi:ATP-binding protein [bacterium]|nr:ATP-binding protein [bacterium]